MSYRILLRNKSTAQFYSGANRWVPNAFEAQQFDTVENAVELARTEKLLSTEVVLQYKNPVCELVIPIKDN